MDEFKKAINSQGFNYVYERVLAPKEERIVKMPPISANKRGINDIGWQSDGKVTLYGTLSSRPESDKALWQEIQECDDINKTVTAIKIVNGGSACNIVIRAILC